MNRAVVSLGSSPLSGARATAFTPLGLQRIRVKLVFIIAAVVAVIAVLLFIVLPWQMGKIDMEGLKDKARTMAGGIARLESAPLDVLALSRSDPSTIKEALQEALQGALEDPTLVYVRVLDAEGNVLDNEQTGLWTQDEPAPWSAPPATLRVQETAHQLHVSQIVHGKEGGKVGTVQLALSLAKLEANRKSFRWLALGFSAVLLLAGGVTSYLAGGAIARPIERMVQATEAVASGDLTRRIEVQSRDEVGLLADRFQLMVERLRTIPTALKGSKDELTPAVDSLTELTRSLTAAMQKQASSLAEASTTMQEIKHTSSLAASKADMVLQVATRADEFSGAGQASVEGSLQGLQEIRSQIENIVGRISDLADRTLQVGEIIESVKDLADQSNVLALNAAIEAAKAGEFGKGFAVVAREIRTLADQSIESTRRIREILSEIQTAIRATVSITEEGKKKMEQSMAQIHASGENLREMTAIVHESSQAARQIAASVSQQNAGTTQIVAAIGELHTAMDQTVVGIKGAEKAADRLKTISGRISEIIEGFRT